MTTTKAKTKAEAKVQKNVLVGISENAFLGLPGSSYSALISILAIDR
jgi:hypothetical protein